jgi:argininosuccinate lyase
MVMPSTYDSIAASDNLTDVASALSSLAINLSRFTHDMLFWATQESGAIRLDDSFIQISSIMPQKRNPVVLEHLRARLSRMLAQSQGVITQCHNIPFGDTQDIEDEIFPLLFGSLETSVEILRLYQRCYETLQNVEHGSSRSSRLHHTELAIPWYARRRSCPAGHQPGMIRTRSRTLRPDELTSDLLRQIAQEKIGRKIHLSESVLRHALDPVAFVDKRAGYGGSAPSATGAILDSIETQIRADQEIYQGVLRKLAEANVQLLTEIERLLEQG